MKQIKLIAVIMVSLSSFIICSGLDAQNNDHPFIKDNHYSDWANICNVSSNSVKPEFPKPSLKEQHLLAELNNTRKNNSTALAKQYMDQLNQLHGTTPVQMVQDPRIKFSHPLNIQVPQGDDIMPNPIVNGTNVVATATATMPTGAPHAGRIWVAVANTSSDDDTINLYYSNNGGTIWYRWYNVYFPAHNRVRPGEMDLEAVYDGTNEWLFMVNSMQGYAPLGNGCFVHRFNTTTNSFFGSYLFFPGYTTPTNNYYNARITSDNAEYFTSTYIYITCSFDSTAPNGSHYERVKYALITNPFDGSPTINYHQPSSNGGFFYFSISPNFSYIHNDIAHFHFSNGTNRVITLFNLDAAGVYLVWSDDYGASVSGSMSFAEPDEASWGRIAFNGGIGNLNGMVTYLKRVGLSNVWHPYYWNTTDGGETLSDWSSGTIDTGSQPTTYIDLTAVRNANNQFKVGYLKDMVNESYSAFYTGWNGSSWSAPPITQVNNVDADYQYSRIRAGYKLGGGDDCIAVWSHLGGLGAYATSVCGQPTGISHNNNEIPKVFSLSQNYPNPFNPTTEIKFDLPKSGLVKLVIYDALGREITTLVSEYRSEGKYSVAFNGDRYASGIYFYKMKAGDFSEVKKMILIK